MALINIATAVKHEEIRKYLEAQTVVHYTFIGKVNRANWQYEVTDPDGSHGDLVCYTVNLIHQLPYGRVILLQVLYDGQMFPGDRIHRPGDPAYDAFHMHMQKKSPSE
jgi:hypothetical protein